MTTKILVQTKRQVIVLALALLSLSLVVTGCTKIFSSSSDIQIVNKPQPGQVAVFDSNIIINTPISHQSITSPVTITGRVKAGDQIAVFIRIRDDQNFILATSTIQLSKDQSGWSSYEVSLTYAQPSAPTGAVDVWVGSPTAASSPDLLSLPIRFMDFKNPIVNLYYSNIIKDPNLLDCSSVYPVQREIPYSNNIITATLSALFSGLSETEIKQGFVSNFPEAEIKLQGMRLATTTEILTLDFNQALQQGVAGSCRVMAVRSQIEQTMKQFVGIKKVVVSIDGETKGVLQP